MKSFCTAALLAGGKSKRMGFDKQSFHGANGRPLSHILPFLTRHFSDVLVVTNQPENYEDTGVRTITDIIPGLGPLSGIHAAISEAKSEYVYIIACDMPVISANYIGFLMNRLLQEPSDACVTRIAAHIEPFHAFYGKRALPVIEADLLSGKSSVYYMLQKITTLYITEAQARRFTPDWSLFCNLNTRDEYSLFINRAEA